MSGVFLVELDQRPPSRRLTPKNYSLYGMMFIGLGSIGNKVTCRRWWLPIIAIAFINLFTIGPYVDQVVFSNNTYLSTVSVVLGFVATAFHLFHILGMVLPKRWVANKPRVQALFAAGVVRAESTIKQSAAHKISGMVDNALDLAQSKDRDAVLETHFGQGLLAFEKLGKVFVPAGGFTWTWRRIYDGSLFKEEGIWLTARLIASNAAQFIVSVFVLIAGIQLTMRIEENYDIDAARRQAGGYVDLLFNNSVAENITAGMVADFSIIMTDFLSGSGLEETCATGNVTDFSETACEYVGAYLVCDSNTTNDPLCTLLDYAPQANSYLEGINALGLLNASGFDATSLVNTTQTYLKSAAQASVDSLYPSQKYMVKVPAVLATIIAFLTAVTLAVTYIPSVTSTTLKLRCGVIPSLRSPRFVKHRYAADTVTILTGSMFWGKLCMLAD